MLQLRRAAYGPGSSASGQPYGPTSATRAPSRSPSCRDRGSRDLAACPRARCRDDRGTAPHRAEPAGLKGRGRCVVGGPTRCAGEP